MKLDLARCHHRSLAQTNTRMQVIRINMFLGCFLFVFSLCPQVERKLALEEADLVALRAGESQIESFRQAKHCRALDSLGNKSK